MNILASSRQLRTCSLLALFLATPLALVKPAWSAFSVSPQQERNFQSVVSELRQLSSPQGQQLASLYEQAHAAMIANQKGLYRQRMDEYAQQLKALPWSEARHIESFVSNLPVPSALPDPTSTQCIASCANGSCTGTFSCTCVNGNPVCIDAAPGPALPPWAPAGLAGALLLTAAGLGLRRQGLSRR